MSTFWIGFEKRAGLLKNVKGIPTDIHLAKEELAAISKVVKHVGYGGLILGSGAAIGSAEANHQKAKLYKQLREGTARNEQ